MPPCFSSSRWIVSLSANCCVDWNGGTIQMKSHAHTHTHDPTNWLYSLETLTFRENATHRSGRRLHTVARSRLQLKETEFIHKFLNSGHIDRFTNLRWWQIARIDFRTPHAVHCWVLWLASVFVRCVVSDKWPAANFWAVQTAAAMAWQSLAMEHSLLTRCHWLSLLCYHYFDSTMMRTMMWPLFVRSFSGNCK